MFSDLDFRCLHTHFKLFSAALEEPVYFKISVKWVFWFGILVTFVVETHYRKYSNHHRISLKMSQTRPCFVFARNATEEDVVLFRTFFFFQMVCDSSCFYSVSAVYFKCRFQGDKWQLLWCLCTLYSTCQSNSVWNSGMSLSLFMSLRIALFVQL